MTVVIIFIVVKALRLTLGNVVETVACLSVAVVAATPLLLWVYGLLDFYSASLTAAVVGCITSLRGAAAWVRHACRAERLTTNRRGSWLALGQHRRLT